LEFFFLRTGFEPYKNSSKKFLPILVDKIPKLGISIKIRVREEFYIQNPQSRIDELLFREPTTKISAPNSKYNCSIDQKVEVRFSSFYMENQKAVNLFESKSNV
jgi:hypothetical protein